GGVALNGKVYAVGGQQFQDRAASFRTEVDAYDPAADTWTAAAPLPRPRSHITNATLVRNGRIVVFGGETTGQQVMTDVSAYDPATTSWVTPTNIPAPRLSGVCDLLTDGRVVYVGGASSTGVKSDAWIGTFA